MMRRSIGLLTKDKKQRKFFGTIIGKNEDHDLTLMSIMHSKYLSWEDLTEDKTVIQREKNVVPCDTLYEDTLDNYFADLAWRHATYNPLGQDDLSKVNDHF